MFVLFVFLFIRTFTFDGILAEEKTMDIKSTTTCQLNGKWRRLTPLLQKKRYLVLEFDLFIVLDPDEGTVNHAPLCNTLPSNNLIPKSMKILALKGLKNLRDNARVYNPLFQT